MHQYYVSGNLRNWCTGPGRLRCPSPVSSDPWAGRGRWRSGWGPAAPTWRWARPAPTRSTSRRRRRSRTTPRRWRTPTPLSSSSQQLKLKLNGPHMTAVSAAVRGGPRPTKGRFTEKAMRDSGPVGKSQARTMAEGAKALRHRWSRRSLPCTDALTPPSPLDHSKCPAERRPGQPSFSSLSVPFWFRVCVYISQDTSAVTFFSIIHACIFLSTLVSNFKKFDPVTFSFLRVDFVCLT